VIGGASIARASSALPGDVISPIVVSSSVAIPNFAAKPSDSGDN